MSSGASIAPPGRLRSSLVVTPVPVVPAHSTRQRRSDVQAVQESVPAISEEGEDDGEEEEEEEEEEKGGEKEEEGEEEEEGGGEEGEKGEEGEGEEGEKGEEEKEEATIAEGRGGSGGEIGNGEGDDGEQGGLEDDEKIGQGKKGGKSGNSEDDGENGRKEHISFISTPTAAQNSPPMETHQRGRPTTPRPAPVTDDDITMQSPPNSPPKLHGASRTTGGQFRGQATGNILNAADFSNSNNNEYIGPVRGQINIYLSKDDPARLSPDSLIAYARLPYDYASKTPIAPVLEKVARRYSPVRSK